MAPLLAANAAISVSNSGNNPTAINPCPSSAPVYNNSKCFPCPSGTFYIYIIGGCYKPKIISNVPALEASTNILVIHNVSLPTIAARDAQLAATGYTIVTCPPNFPLYDPTKQQCVVCQPGTYYLLSNLTCYVPQTFSNLSALFVAPNTISVGKANLVSLFAHRISFQFPVKHCPGNAPMYNGTHCISCVLPTYYLYLNRSCYTPP